MCLSDYIHLMIKHYETETLNKISYDLEKYHNIEICGCKWTKRHYRNRQDEKNNNNFYIFHLESLGLRVQKMNYLNYSCVDKEITQISKKKKKK